MQVKKKRTKKRSVRRIARAHRTHTHVNEKGRVRFLLFVTFLIIGGIIYRLWFLQVHAGSAYRAQADAQHTIDAKLMPQRGAIFLREGEGYYPAAINKDFALVYVVPRDVRAEDHARIITLFKDVLGAEMIDEDSVRAKLAKKDDPYEVIARKVEKDVAARITEAGVRGVHVMPEVYRFYPAGEIAAQVLGFVGSDGTTYRGRYGVEASFEDILAGTAGHVRQQRDASGRWITLTDRQKEAARDGADVVLTIDYAVQYAVENILRETVERHGADSGSIIVMRPDGTVLAMASQPGFDPNTYNTVKDITVYRNPIVSDAYEAGSVVKPITMAIGIDDGKVRPDSTYVDTGVVHIGGYDIRNSEDKVYGVQTMYQVLDESINTGVIHVERLVGHKRFAQYFERFGFGHVTGIPLPGEAAGTIRNLQPPIKPIQFYTASFGQGVTMTLLQLARAYGVLANDGMLMTPRIVDRIISKDGREEVQSPHELHRVIRAQTAREIRAMLESVVLNGHGKRAAVPGYRVGGKTGTAQIAKIGVSGYRDDATIGSFAGLAPIEKPQFVVAVRIDNPKDVQWAESTAAPAFQKVMAFLLDYYNIPPTEEIVTENINASQEMLTHE